MESGENVVGLLVKRKLLFLHCLVFSNFYLKFVNKLYKSSGVFLHDQINLY